MGEEIGMLILSNVISILVSAVATGIVMTLGFDKRIALLQLTIESMARSMDEIKEWLKSLEADVKRIDRGESVGFHTNGKR